ncbi:hypothetical protein ACS0TY_008606 [Phlomoides rotata]
MLLFFIQLGTLLSINFPVFLCENISEYSTCTEPFQCGRLKNISYPFWGGSRPLSCGYPGFELNCDGDAPLLNISSLSYRLLRIDFSTSTLTLAREDLWNNTCSKFHRNTTIDSYIFEIPKDSGDRDVTLYYGCAGQLIRVLNKFNCDVDGVTTVNVFDSSSRGPGINVTCNGSLSVPVNQAAARDLETKSIDVLREVLAGGFSVRWSADNQNCKGCRRSGGTCAYSRESSTAVCYKRSRRRLQVGAGNLPPVARGMPPSQSPGTSPFGSDKNRTHPVPPASASSTRRAGNIAGVVCGVIGTNILSVVLVCYIRRRYCLGGNTNNVINQDVEKCLLQHGSLASKRYMYSEIKKITKSFDDKLGQGAYGSVYKGVLPGGCLVAVKVLTDTNGDGEEFINEVASISRTSHVNIVNLLGFCYDGNHRALVYEYMPNRSLDKFMGKDGSHHLHFDKLYMIAVGVAKGLEYLHTGCNTRIVHFDIKPQNILLDEDFSPKISDFGLAKLCKKKQSVLSLLGTRGTIGYIAPEVFSRHFGKVSEKSDVYSYGMMVLEMAGANKTVESETAKSSENYFPDKIYELITVDVIRKTDDYMAEEVNEIVRKLFLVGFWCIQTVPSDRPSMSKVVEMLEGSLESIPVPPKPVLFTTSLTGQEFSEFSSSFSAYDENSEEV